MAECKETRELCKRIEALGAKTYPAVASRFSPTGWPDRWVGSRWWSGWLEFKSDDGILQAIQRERAKQILAACGPGSWFLVRGREEWKVLQVENWAGEVLGVCITDPVKLLELLAKLKGLAGIR